MPIKTSLTATAAAVALTFGAGMAPVLAQEAATDTPMEAPMEAGQFSEAQLEAFVAAALEVSGIQQEAAAQLMETQDEGEQNALLEQANADMIGAIEAEPGISVPEYVAIAEAAEADPTLRATLEEMIVAAQMQ
jgi:hypothetical protein